MTISGFVKAAHKYLSAFGFDYGNYPLTGGPAGAESGSMLILALSLMKHFA